MSQNRSFIQRYLPFLSWKRGERSSILSSYEQKLEELVKKEEGYFDDGHWWTNVGGESLFPTGSALLLKKSDIVLICLTKFITQWIEPPVRAYAIEGGVLPATHPANVIMDRPNSDMGQLEFNVYRSYFLATGGNVFSHKLRAADGRVVGLRAYSLNHVKPVYNAARTATEYYEYRANPGVTKPEIWPVEDVIHTKWPVPDPSDPNLGIMPLRTLSDDVKMDLELTRIGLALMANDAIPRGIITMPQSELQGTDASEIIRQRFKEKHGGLWAGGVEVLDEGATYTRVSANLQELDTNNLRAVPEARIPAAFGMDAIFAGLTAGLKHASYNNFKDSRLKFVESFLLPFWQLDSGQLTEKMVTEIDYAEPFILKRDLSAVGALQEVLLSRHETAVKDYQGGILTRNESRALIGYPSMPGEDTFIPLPTSPQPTTTKTELPTTSDDFIN